MNSTPIWQQSTALALQKIRDFRLDTPIGECEVWGIPLIQGVYVHVPTGERRPFLFYVARGQNLNWLEPRVRALIDANESMLGKDLTS